MKPEDISIAGPIFALSCFVIAMIFAVIKLEKIRKFTKPFYSFFISIICFLLAPNYPIICMFFVIHCVGDVISGFSYKRSMHCLSQIVLLGAHILDLIHYVQISESFGIWLILIFLLIFAGLAILLFIKLSKKIKKVHIMLGSLYFTVLICTIIYMIIGSFIATPIYLIGAIGIIVLILGDLYEIKWTYLKRDTYNKIYTTLSYFIGLLLIFVGTVLPLIEF